MFNNNLENILNWIQKKYGIFGELRIGIWDEDEYPMYYALVYEDTHAHVRNDRLVAGQSSYNANTLDEALELLWKELGDIQ